MEEMKTVQYFPEEVTVFAKWCGRLWGGGRRDATHITGFEVWASQEGQLRLREPAEHERRGWIQLHRAKVGEHKFVRLSHRNQMVGLARMSDPENVIGMDGMTTLDELIARYGGALPTDEDHTAAEAMLDGTWTSAPAKADAAPALASGKRSAIFHPLDAVVEAATALRENWFEGAMAQAHYRDKLVEAMVAAKLIRGPS